MLRELACVLFLSGASSAAVAQDLSGVWKGYWTRRGDTLPVTMVIRRVPDAAGYAATFSSERLRVTGIPFAAVRIADGRDVTLTLRGDRTTAEFAGTLQRDSLIGVFQEGADAGRFAFARASAAPASIVEREVTFSNGSVTLAGSILLPRTGNASSGVVFLHGSGAEGRWASRFLAVTLAERGVAALIFDKRGVGASTGDWRQATVDDLVGDAVAAVEQLRHEATVDQNRVGVHGHSQGGTLAPLVVKRSGHVAFVVASAAAGLPTDSIELFSVLNSVYPAATSAADSADARDYANELVAAAYHGKDHARLDSLAIALRARPWFFAPPPADNQYWRFSADFSRFDPIAAWTGIHVPVLLLYGSADQRVPAAASARRISAVLLSGEGADVTLRIFPGADHSFRLPPGPGGWPGTASNYLSTLVDWLTKR